MTRRTSDADQHVGRRLRELRTDRGLSQTEVADALGVTFQQVQKYETGANRVSAGRLWALAGYFGVSVRAFYQGLS